MREIDCKAQLELALAIATRDHAGQVDKAGADYILHPKKVSSLCATPIAKCVAMLHDVVEDCGETVESLVAQGIHPEIARRVGMMSRDKPVDYLEYVKCLAADPVTREVKMADLTHNMDVSRFKNPEDISPSRIERYRKAYAILKAAK